MMSIARPRWLRWAVPAALGVLYALTRWPIYTAGYGGDGDYWNVAAVAGSFLETGRYMIGRPPGNPLHEFQMVLSLRIAEALGVHGWWVANFFTVLWSLVLLWAVDRIRASIGTGVAWRWPLLGALAFLPIFWAHSADGSDHAPAAALALLSLLLAFRASGASARTALRWSVVAGLALGLAVGYRLGSVTVAPACLWLLVRARHPRGAFALAVMLMVSAAVCYLPIWWTGQLVVPDPRRHGFIGEAMRALWRGHGALTPGPVSLALLFFWFRRRETRSRVSRFVRAGTPLEQSLLVAIAAGLGLFLLAPRDAAYLLPAAACWLVVLTRVLRPGHMIIVAVFGAMASHVTPVPPYRDASRTEWALVPGEVATAIMEGRRTRDYPLHLLGKNFQPGTVVVIERALQGIGGDAFDPAERLEPVPGLWSHPSHPGVWFGGYHVLLRDESRRALASDRMSLAIDQGAWDRAKREMDADIYDAVTPWPATVGTFKF